MTLLHLTWQTNHSGDWHALDEADIEKAPEHGVYVIWRAGNPPQTIRVGKGNITAALLANRTDPLVLDHARGSQLLVTWAKLPEALGDEVLLYLLEWLNPAIVDPFRWVDPVPVNLPWEPV